MRISHIGGIIAAASKQVAQPLKQIGDISAIKRIVITYQQAGIFPIVVVTGKDTEEVKHQLTGYGIVFIQCRNTENPELMDSLKDGLEYLFNKCDKVAFTPVNVPLFTAATLLALSAEEGEVIAPSYQGHGGHPVMIDNSVIPRVISYSGIGGLKGAIENGGLSRKWLSVADKGVITSVQDETELEAQAGRHTESILQPVLHMTLEKEVPFFSTRVKLLLFLIDDTENMRICCRYSGIAYSKAWDMINVLEKNLGFMVVERQHGGTDGGKTKLTWKGRSFLLAYQKFEEQLRIDAQRAFAEQLVDTKVIDQGA